MRVPRVVAITALVCFAALPADAMARDHVHVVGSSTLFPFAAAVAEAFAAGGRWKAPVVESVGTGNGFRLFCAGAGEATPDITDASRPMTSSEALECARNGVGPITGIRVGLDGMLLVSATAGQAFSLTREQIYLAVARNVARGGVLVPNPYRRWREIAATLPDLPIRIYGPAPNHGTRDAFVALALMPPCERTPEIRALPAERRRQHCQALREDGAWVDVSQDYAVLLRRVIADPQSLGVLGFSYLKNNRGQLRAARIDGIEPGADSIGGWTYPLARPLFIYVKQAHIGRVPGLAEFVREFTSERAVGPAGYLVERGLMPLPKGHLAAERRKLDQLAAIRAR